MTEREQETELARKRQRSPTKSDNEQADHGLEEVQQSKGSAADGAAAIPAEDDDGSSEDENDVGPLPVGANDENSTQSVGAVKKKQRVLHHESLFLENLPDQDMYERSLMHRDVVNFVLVTQ